MGRSVWQPDLVSGDSVVVLSLEPWDDVWRRNQHLTSQLLRQELVRRVVFVEPARPGRGRRCSPRPGVEVVRPALVVPRRLGGGRLVAARLRRSVLRSADVLWVNDAPLGALCLRDGGPRPAYDVTDDWRTSALSARERRRLVRAEDRLTRAARVIVCSAVLQQRWRDRYGVTPPVVQNGTDPDAYRAAVPVALTGTAPRVGYLGTLHGERLDLDLVVALARDPRVGTVFLVGPDHLTPAERARLDATPGVVRPGAVAASDVPGWAVAFDVLVCPHLVTDFTRSLDGIKAHEYLASGRPVVATATSGFQDLATAPGVQVVDRAAFADAVAHAGDPLPPGTRGASWAGRAVEFAAALGVGP